MAMTEVHALKRRIEVLEEAINWAMGLGHDGDFPNGEGPNMGRYDWRVGLVRRAEMAYHPERHQYEYAPQGSPPTPAPDGVSIDRPKESWLEMVDREGDAAVGAVGGGVGSASPTSALEHRDEADQRRWQRQFAGREFPMPKHERALEDLRWYAERLCADKPWRYEVYQMRGEETRLSDSIRVVLATLAATDRELDQWKHEARQVAERLRLVIEKQQAEWRDHLNAHAVEAFPAMTTEDIVGTLDYVGAIMPGGCQEVIAEAARRLTALEAQNQDLLAALAVLGIEPPKNDGEEWVAATENEPVPVGETAVDAVRFYARIDAVVEAQRLEAVAGWTEAMELLRHVEDGPCPVPVPQWDKVPALRARLAKAGGVA